ncbi:metalloregulator ArsR/SmtB family transcription factor [Yinghuangia sp. ASG 101]|uniref:ArsR/SmtB family transcription factor n=1 Tax=Yinghuangia sp. ASG 101 TaxID=2896848 RepID=UPI001E60EA9F|nr:metalloregulator ArsR/SmtB family transcription factor [Yinghuangia sp. ASG 101]UGQ11579.1 metalloregulator ArsR/SmtB family transcription factor [Yinghuangia sp. ASG 101]
MASRDRGDEAFPEEVLTDAAAAFGLLASTARLHIMWALAHGASDVSGLAARVGGALPAVSQHLAKLKLGGLVRAQREGRRVVYLIDDPDVATMVCWFMEQRASRAHTGTARGRARAPGA